MALLYFIPVLLVLALGFYLSKNKALSVVILTMTIIIGLLLYFFPGFFGGPTKASEDSSMNNNVYLAQIVSSKCRL